MLNPLGSSCELCCQLDDAELAMSPCRHDRPKTFSDQAGRVIGRASEIWADGLFLRDCCAHDDLPHDRTRACDSQVVGK